MSRWKINLWLTKNQNGNFLVWTSMTFMCHFDMAVNWFDLICGLLQLTFYCPFTSLPPPWIGKPTPNPNQTNRNFRFWTLPTIKIKSKLQKKYSKKKVQRPNNLNKYGFKIQRIFSFLHSFLRWLFSHLCFESFPSPNNTVIKPY